MSHDITIRDLVSLQPDHPVPHPGNVVSLDYPLRDGLAVRVETDAFGAARLRVTAEAGLVAEVLDAATLAIARVSETAGPDGQSAPHRPAPKTSLPARRPWRGRASSPARYCARRSSPSSLPSLGQARSRTGTRPFRSRRSSGCGRGDGWRATSPCVWRFLPSHR